MRMVGIAVTGLVVFYFFINGRSTEEAAAVLTGAVTFYAILAVYLLNA